MRVKRKGMKLCQNPIGYAPTAKAPESAMPVTARVDWVCRRGKSALPAILTGAGNARTVGEWVVSMQRGNPLPGMKLNSV
jgi:hypothetical protein